MSRFFAFLLLFSLLESSALAEPLPAPTNVVAYAPNQKRVHLMWTDNATNEELYFVDRWNPNTEEWEEFDTLGPNFEVYRGLAPSVDEQTVKYRVAAFRSGDNLNSLNWAEAEVVKPKGDLDLLIVPTPSYPAGIEIPEGLSFRAGLNNVNFTLPCAGGNPDRFIADGLPAGLTLNPNTGEVTGTLQTPGVYRFLYGVEFPKQSDPEDEPEEGGEPEEEGEPAETRVFQQVRFLRILPAASTPQIDKKVTLKKQNVGVSGYIDLRTLFRDPARPYGAWISIAGESIIVALHDTATPKTVANFRAYMAANAYNGSLIHRSIPRFMLQGGGFYLKNGGPTNQWISVPKRFDLFNEPGISNTRGTIAMAKLGGNPDSATSQWFINTGVNNPENLDYQNSGFTVFGEVVGSRGMQVADAINNLSTTSTTISIEGMGSSSMGDIPLLNGGGASLTMNNAVRIDFVTPVAPIEISLASNSAPKVLGANVSGMFLFIRSLGPIGTANLKLRATNLDGNTVDYVLPFTVDDLIGPSFRINSLKLLKKPARSISMKGKVTDGVALGSWRYRINRKAWKTGGKLKGKSANVSKTISGFKKGTNTIEFQALDARKNSSGIGKAKVVIKK